MAVAYREFIADIEENIYEEDNAFIMKSVSHDMFVTGKKVKVPQAGTYPNDVQKDRTVYPIPVKERADSSLEYPLSKYDSGAIKIDDVEEIRTTYELRQSIMKDFQGVMFERIAAETLYAWAATGAARIKRTTGSTASTNLAPGATGSRKKLLIADVAAAVLQMDADKMPAMGRYAVIPYYMYYDLFTIDNLLRKDVMAKTTLPDGVIDKVLNLNFIKRSISQVYDNTGTPVKKAVGAATAASDNGAMICWHESKVAKALGAIKFFSTEGDAVYQADIFSAYILHAAKALRTDNAGIVAVVQSA